MFQFGMWYSVPDLSGGVSWGPSLMGALFFENVKIKPFISTKCSKRLGYRRQYKQQKKTIIKGYTGAPRLE